LTFSINSDIIFIVKKSEKKEIMGLKKGDHLVSDRGLYTHHGIYIGDNKVIHYSGLSDDIESGPIEIVDLEEFHKGNGYYVESHSNKKYSSEEIVRRAKSRLGEDSYSVTGNNCEHFVNWAIEDKHISKQVDDAIPIVTGGESIGVGAGTTAVVSSAGAVSGLSGAGVMSGLAEIGVGGAVGGIATIAGGAGLGTAAILNNTVLKDDESLDEKEREARSIGRKATVAGAVGATAGGIAAVSAAGTTAGLSAAGITSGLAAIGGTVGGGMAAGTAIVAAAPVAAATAVGYGIYKFAKWLTDD
jgi:hypothetical protein